MNGVGEQTFGEKMIVFLLASNSRCYPTLLDQLLVHERPVAVLLKATAARVRREMAVRIRRAFLCLPRESDARPKPGSLLLSGDVVCGAASSTAKERTHDTGMSVPEIPCVCAAAGNVNNNADDDDLDLSAPWSTHASPDVMQEDAGGYKDDEDSDPVASGVADSAADNEECDGPPGSLRAPVPTSDAPSREEDANNNAGTAGRQEESSPERSPDSLQVEARSLDSLLKAGPAERREDVAQEMEANSEFSSPPPSPNPSPRPTRLERLMRPSARLLPSNTNMSYNPDCFQGSLLTISPAEELNFGTGPGEGKEAKDVITLSSSVGNHIAFKVKTTAPEKFRLKPSVGIVRAGDVVQIEVNCLPQHLATVNAEKFLILAMEVPYRNFDPGDSSVWRRVPKQSLMEHKLRCSNRRKDRHIEQIEDLTKQVASARLWLIYLIISHIAFFVLTIVFFSLSFCLGEDLFANYFHIPIGYCASATFNRRC